MSVRINFTFCPPPLGKPNPTEHRPESGPDTRSRIPQIANKGNTCFFAACNLLRDRWKAPNTENLPERIFEREVSSLRKQLSTSDDVGYEDFFAKMGILPTRLYELAKETEPPLVEFYFQNKEWELLEECKKKKMLSVAARFFIADRFNFKTSTWNPTQPFLSLVSELQTHGPLIVGGFFGESWYKSEPKKLNKSVMDRSLYGWAIAAERERSSSAHAIVLIGTETIDQRDMAYYINPSRTNDPAHPEEQWIFCISYKHLIDNICDRAGIHRKWAPSNIGYAIYH